ncbi:hypothetical protein Ancab_018614 [Ancistrocladus abbreviatus]
MDPKSTSPELANPNNRSIKSGSGSTFRKEGLYRRSWIFEDVHGQFEGFQCKYAKHIINELDVDNFYCKYTTIGRDVLDGKYECIVNETRFYLKGNGCIYKMTTRVHPLPRTEFNEEGTKMGQEKMKKMFKVVEEYLIAHPSAYP